MKHTILETEYEKRFIDTKTVPPTTAMQLRGLAAVIQDAQSSWRPSLTELISIIPRNDFGKKLICSGSAYGAAKQIKDIYPGPALLLFGSALDSIGDSPQVELQKNLKHAKKVLQEKGIFENDYIKIMFNAAQQRADFDKVGEKLIKEFSQGLRRLNKYDEQFISSISKKIVEATNHVRHNAILDRYIWSSAENKNGIYVIDTNLIPNDVDFWESFYFQFDQNSMRGGKSTFQDLIHYAMNGCAQAIYTRIEILINGKKVNAD